MNETIQTFRLGHWSAIEVELPDDVEKRYEGFKAAGLPHLLAGEIRDEHGAVVGQWLKHDRHGEDDSVFPMMAEVRVGNGNWHATALISDPHSYMVFTHFFLNPRRASDAQSPKAKRTRTPKKVMPRRSRWAPMN